MINEIAILRQTLREFAEAETSPHVMEWDEAKLFPLNLVPTVTQYLAPSRSHVP